MKFEILKVKRFYHGDTENIEKQRSTEFILLNLLRFFKTLLPPCFSPCSLCLRGKFSLIQTGLYSIYPDKSKISPGSLTSLKMLCKISWSISLISLKLRNFTS
jgi:hypothetical protein